MKSSKNIFSSIYSIERISSGNSFDRSHNFNIRSLTRIKMTLWNTSLSYSTYNSIFIWISWLIHDLQFSAIFLPKLSWTPLHIYNMLKFSGKKFMKENTCIYLGKFFYGLIFINDALNPIIYSFMGMKFRRGQIFHI